MKHKTSELEGALLDVAVAKAACVIAFVSPRMDERCWSSDHDALWEPSTDWAIGGPIIERKRISVLAQVTVHSGVAVNRVDKTWEAESERGHRLIGPTPLIAAMRAYVASSLGDEVELP